MNSAADENAIWEGGPTQWIAVKSYMTAWVIVLLILTISIVPGFLFEAGIYALWGLVLLPFLFIYMIYVFLSIKTETYKLTTQRLIMTEGILSRKTEEIELYRVKDWNINKPFWLRLIGRGHINLETSDTTSPTVVLKGVQGPEAVRELIRTHVEAYRDQKRVRQLDMDVADAGDDFGAGA